MKLIKTFNTREEVNAEKKKLAVEYRSLYTDYVDGKFVITFVNGTDDPANSEESKLQYTKFNRQKKLNKKLKDSSLNIEEINEYMRLRI